MTALLVSYDLLSTMASAPLTATMTHITTTIPAHASFALLFIPTVLLALLQVVLHALLTIL